MEVVIAVVVALMVGLVWLWKRSSPVLPDFMSAEWMKEQTYREGKEAAEKQLEW